MTSLGLEGVPEKPVGHNQMRRALILSCYFTIIRLSPRPKTAPRKFGRKLVLELQCELLNMVEVC